MKRLLTVALAGGLLAACGGYKSHVRVDEVALGRVVIYRNGVAYYERRAHVDRDTLTVTVPKDKVDDFLKSLTVLDGATGEPLPVAFPRHEVSQPGFVDMTIQLPAGKRATDVVLTYITESPAWKPSYRVAVLDDDRVLLQGWAIVDNTSGEDWKGVLIGVGSSSALSFRYDLWSVRDVHRATLASEERFAAAPPTGGSPYREHGQSDNVLAQLTDQDIPRPPGHPQHADQPAPEPAGRYYAAEVSADYESSGPARTRAGSAGAGRSRGPSREEIEAQRKQQEVERSQQREARQRQVRLYGQQIRAQRNVVVIEGYAAPGEANPEQRALERANLLRNQLIEEGVPPAQVQVAARGVVAGQGAGVKVVVSDEVLPGADDPHRAAGADQPVGEAHFQSSAPMTVKRGSSVMVSVVREPTDGDVVYLYDPESARGNARYAFRAVRFRNPTDSTLETGPVTVYGKAGFIGEGLTDPIPPKATAVVPFALDRQVVVTREESGADRIASLVTLERGVLTANVQHLRQSRLKITNRLHRPVSVFVRHTVDKGWQLTQAPKVFERLGSSYLFHVTIDAGATEFVDIEEATPLVKTLDLETEVGLELVQIYLQGEDPSSALAERVAQLIGLRRTIADTQQAIDSWQERLTEYRVRMDELHGQLVSMQKAKAKGTLVKHLEGKLQDISERVHAATIEVVGLEERLMLSRLKFQDGVAELTLPDRLARGD